MTAWFGESWGGPCCDPALHTPTPVGDLCTQCAQPITETDKGMRIPLGGVVLIAYHLACFLVHILGPGTEGLDS